MTNVILCDISGDIVAGTCQSNRYLDKYLERDKGFEKKECLIKILIHSQYFLMLKIAYNLT